MFVSLTFLSLALTIFHINIIKSTNERFKLKFLLNSSLCDINVFSKISVSRPEDDHEHNDHDAEVRTHRSCPPNIQKGYAVVSSPPLPLSPQTVREGKYELRAEARTQGGKRIFCVEGSFDVTT